MNLYKIIALLAALITHTSTAGEADTLWTNETTTLRTIGIGMDFSQFPECPKKQNPLFDREEYFEGYEINYPEEFKDRPCYKSTKKRPLIKGAPMFTIDNLPFIKGGGREVQVTMLDAKIQEIRFEFLNSYKNIFFDALREKYGSPTEQRLNTYQSGLGQTFHAVSARWYGKTVILSYNEVTHRKDWGLIAMYSVRFADAINAQQSDTTEQIKKGL